jgi:hypothetical protein
MSASVISPSGKVLVRRARCSLQPGPNPLPMPVLLAPSVQLDQAMPLGAAAAGEGIGETMRHAGETGAEADLTR